MRAGSRIGIAVVLGGAAVLLSGSGPLRAQMMLPGAVDAPTPSGTSQPAAPSAGGAAPARRKPAGGPAAVDGEHVNHGVEVSIPSLGALGGKTVSLNGSASAITFAPTADRGVAVTRLTLAGEKISNSREACHVEPPGTPLAVSPMGRPNGLERGRIALDACPIEFNVLDGAVLVPPDQQACTFAEADCRVPVAGVWGPVPTDLGPDKIKGLERARAGAEGAVRANYKALTASTKDRPTIMGYAHDQAQFTSTREETCRDYAEEGRHGLCATRFTEARAAQLHAWLVVALEQKAARKAAKHRAGR